ncbi:MAG: PHP domain-containing protein [Clostridia bacterium]|nr:PHP domain-containing protein [Clostridia bacterium]
MKIDLQLHSLYSDGYNSPQQLARMLKVNNIKVASLTDHNTIAGQKEFAEACKKYNIKSIPGLELYVRYKSRTFNLLWYNYQMDSLELQKMLESTWKRRRLMAQKVDSRLQRLGIRFNLGKFIDNHPYYLPVNHWLDELKKSRYNRSIFRKIDSNKEILDDNLIRILFYPKKGVNLQEARVSLTRVLNLRKKVGGQLIMCHPGLNNKLKNNLLMHLFDAGLDGAELLSPHHSISTVIYITREIKKRNLIATAGSDFHKAAPEDFNPRYAWQWCNFESRDLYQIHKIIGGRPNKSSS